MPNKIREESSIAVTLPDEDEHDESEEEAEREETAEELTEMYESQQLRKLFIGNLSYQTDSEALKEYFIKYGEIEECNVPVDSRTKLSKGFGFVIYRHSKTLDEVMKLRPHKIDGRILEPRRAIRREEADNPAANASTEKMYVGPIKPSTHESIIREYFAEHGNVTEVEIAKKGDHCFVTFDDFDPVDKCVNMKKHMMNGMIAMCKKGLTKTAMIEADQRYHQRKRRRQEREEREKRDYDLAKHGYNPQRDYWRSGHERAPHRRYPTTFGKGEDERPGHSGSGSHSRDVGHGASTSNKYNRDNRDSDRRPRRSPPARRSRSPRRTGGSGYRGSDRRDRSPPGRGSSDRDPYSSRSGRSSGDKSSAYPPPPPHYPPPPPHGYPGYGDPSQMHAYPPPPREYLERYYEHYYGQPPPSYAYDAAAAHASAYPGYPNTMPAGPQAGQPPAASNPRNSRGRDSGSGKPDSGNPNSKASTSYPSSSNTGTSYRPNPSASQQQGQSSEPQKSYYGEAGTGQPVQNYTGYSY